MPRLRCLCMVGVALSLLTCRVYAEEKYTFIVEKQEKKAKNRWSLEDWLETRDRMRLMDLWLAMHSPTPYEFYAGAAYKSGILQSGGNYQGWDFTLSGYAYFFGIEIQRHTSSLSTRWMGLVNFRVFGLHNQATNFTFQGGFHQEDRAGVISWNPTIGAHLTLYLARPFGVASLYRHAFAGGGVAAMDRFEIGAFIDFKFVRVFGDYLAETETGNAARSFKGFQVGTRIYF